MIIVVPINLAVDIGIGLKYARLDSEIHISIEIMHILRIIVKVIY